MKKKQRKLNLDDLEIESFATTVASEVVGGHLTHGHTCDATSCQPTCDRTCPYSCAAGCTYYPCPD